MEKRTFSLTKQHDEFIQSLVKSGQYASGSEVIREGLRLMEIRRTKLEALKRDIQEGLDDIAAGRVHTLEEVRADMMKIAKEFRKPQ